MDQVQTHCLSLMGAPDPSANLKDPRAVHLSLVHTQCVQELIEED